MTQELLTDERLAYLLKWAPYHGLPGQPITPRDSFLEDPDEILSVLTELQSRRQSPSAEWQAVVSLIREEAAKDNSCLGRSDALAFRRIRAILDLDPFTGKALPNPPNKESEHG